MHHEGMHSLSKSCSEHLPIFHEWVPVPTLISLEFWLGGARNSNFGDTETVECNNFENAMCQAVKVGCPECAECAEETLEACECVSLVGGCPDLECPKPFLPTPPPARHSTTLTPTEHTCLDRREDSSVCGSLNCSSCACCLPVQSSRTMSDHFLTFLL